jgi:PTH1 family peptidyl-tRNA hydrolase
MNKSNCTYIVGLGNPLPKYNFTPHNLGFIFVDQILLRDPNATPLKVKEQQAWKTGKYIVSKPTTYMNLSGKAIRELFKYSKLSAQEFVRALLVVHDDIALPMHTMRLKDGKENPGLGGHNGLRSIVAEFQHLGLKQQEAPNFHRLRLGCKPENTNSDLATYVLTSMSKDDITKWLETIDIYISDNTQ